MQTLTRYLLALALALAAGLVLAEVFQNRVRQREGGGYRTIESNGIPDHAYGEFPRRGNPNRVAEQNHRYRLPLAPKQAERITPLHRGPFGVARNGVPFDPGAAEYWRGDPRWQYEALSGKINLGMDENNAHVQPNGAYHYHGMPTGLVGAKRNMQHIGYAADGFPIYARYGFVDARRPGAVRAMKSSYRLREGARPAGNAGPGGDYDGTFVGDYEYAAGSGDLDRCNGREGVTPEYPAGIYHYYITDQFPFVPRCFRGTPDPSFRHGPPGFGPGGRPPGGPGGFGPGGRRPPPGFGPPPHGGGPPPF